MIVIVCKYTVTPLPADNSQSTFIHEEEEEESEKEHEGKERKVAPGGLCLPSLCFLLSLNFYLLRIP